MDPKSPFPLDDDNVFLFVIFFCCHVRTGTLVSTQPISKVVLTTEKVSVVVASYERTLIQKSATFSTAF